MIEIAARYMFPRRNWLFLSASHWHRNSIPIWILYYIMEQLTTLRSEVVQRLLESTSNIRIKRMFLYMAEKAGHYWFEELDTDKMDLGAGKLQLVKHGVLNKKYSITVPKELDDYEG